MIEPATSRIYEICVGFRAASISAASVLARSRVQFATQPSLSGPSLCQVAHIPVHYSTCLPTGAMFWAIFAKVQGGPWLSATEGLGTTLFSGDELGLRYDSTNGSAEPPGSQPSPGVSAPK